MGDTVKRYKARTLFSGYVIGKADGHQYVGVPDKFKDHVTLVEFDNKVMTIKDWTSNAGTREFKDKFNRDKTYRLYYFQWSAK